MAHLITLGYVPWVVERNITPIIKRDLYNCIDILALHPDGKLLAIQVTSGDHHAERVAKVRDSGYLTLMLECGWRVEVWSYRKLVRTGWTLRREGVDDDCRANTSDAIASAPGAVRTVRGSPGHGAGPAEGHRTAAAEGAA